MIRLTSATEPIRPYQKDLYLLPKLIDASCIIGSFWLLCLMLDRSWADQSSAGFVAVASFLLIGEGAKLYQARHDVFPFHEYRVLLVVWLTTIFVLLLIGTAAKTTEDYSRLVVGSWFVLAPLTALAWRVCVRQVASSMHRRRHDMRTVAIAGAGHNALRVVDAVECAPWLGLRVAGVFDDRAIDRQGVTRTVHGSFDVLVERARGRLIEVIYIALPLAAGARLQELLDRLSDTTASVYVVPEVLPDALLRGYWGYLGALPVISIYETPFQGLSGWFKRLEDIVFTSAILPIIAVPILLIAIGIHLTSPGPVLFRQKRYGLDGREIEVWKFRTMRVCEADGMVTQATRDDPRVTRLGAFLRRTSLDELPQFINVLQGTMSVVGPRPHAVLHNEQYRSLINGYMLRHKVKPGITGWAQVSGWRGETDTLDKMEQRVRHDLWYIRNWSPWLDLKIVLLTVIRGFVGRNAY